MPSSTAKPPDRNGTCPFSRSLHHRPRSQSDRPADSYIDAVGICPMSTLNDLFDAVRDAMDVAPPYDFAHRNVRERIRSARADYVCGVLEQADSKDLDTTVRALRLAPALFPVNYRISIRGSEGRP
ncbi:hypothetical protein [Nocardiopsis suaedae]|uniref:Uncharacterized protein n=1 Tax=Nocardiopsis suaedae TaxID=3018444 RepID=A0ABT4TQ52_9ACTN|nr:hypothetical protein [Nocardiopsis suaedae]MDA2806819.1 hypothetical protein [Nocardiopsis suaedae]